MPIAPPWSLRYEPQAPIRRNPNFSPSLLRTAIALCLIASVAAYVTGTIHWPFVNDPAQISYMCFLMDHGRAPYKDIMEMNMPGIYLTNWLVMHLLGGGALAWRIFDFSLLGAMSAAMLIIAWPYDWLGGVVSAALFALFHGRDGPAHAGQRDFIISILLVWACAFLFLTFRRCNPRWMAGFGFCVAAAATIKPLPIVFSLVILVLLPRAKRLNLSITKYLLFSIGGILAPLLIVTGFLLHEHALTAFLQIFFHVLPFYSHIGRASIGFLLSAINVIPSFSRLALILVASLFVCRTWWNWECRILVAGMLFGLFSWFAQGKGFPYHRYPLYAFVLLWGGMQLTMAIRGSKWSQRIGWAGLIFAAVMAPGNAHKAVHEEWAMNYIDTLTANLNALGGTRLTGHVQCIAMTADCDTTLYDMKLVQATGLSYDYFVFGDPSQPVVIDARREFWKELQKNPPDVFIVSIGLYPVDAHGGTADYGKLDEWPVFSSMIHTQYQEYIDREFKPKVSGVSGYRVYVRRGYRYPAEHSQG